MQNDELKLQPTVELKIDDNEQAEDVDAVEPTAEVVINRKTVVPYKMSIEGCELLCGASPFHTASHEDKDLNAYYRTNPYKGQLWKRGSVADIAYQDARFLVPKGTKYTLTVNHCTEDASRNFGNGVRHPFTKRLYKDKEPITLKQFYTRLGSRSAMLYKFIPQPNAATEKLFNKLQYLPTLSIFPYALFKTLFDCTYPSHVAGSKCASFFTIFVTGPLAASAYAYHYAVQLCSIALSHASLGLTIYTNLILMHYGKSNWYLFLASSLLSAAINVYTHIYKNPLWTADGVAHMQNPNVEKFRSVLIALIDSMTLEVPALHLMNSVQGFLKCFIADPLLLISREQWTTIWYKKDAPGTATLAPICDRYCNPDYDPQAASAPIINRIIKGLISIGLLFSAISTYFVGQICAAVANAVGYVKYCIYGGATRFSKATALALTGDCKTEDGHWKTQEFQDSIINMVHFGFTFVPHVLIYTFMTKLIPIIEPFTGSQGFGPWCGAFYLLGALAFGTQLYNFCINTGYDNAELRMQGKGTLSCSDFFPPSAQKRGSQQGIDHQAELMKKRNKRSSQDMSAGEVSPASP